MSTTAKYDRDKLVDLLAERATFERTAIKLYDALLESIADVDDAIVKGAVGDLERHRDEERDHAEWLDGLLRRLGGEPTHGLQDAVHVESRALEEVIKTARDGAGLLPAFHAMLAAELMDAEGWKLLLDIAEAMGDARAVRELRTRVEHEDEHLALIRRLVLALAKDSVQLDERAEGRSPRKGEPSEAVDLNRASATELRRLEGIDGARARRILDYRREHGGFGSVEELERVPGFDGALLSKVRGKTRITH